MQLKNKELRGMRIIGSTAHGLKEQVKKFLESGIEECIHKPISKNIIKKLINVKFFYDDITVCKNDKIFYNKEVFRA